MRIIGGTHRGRKLIAPKGMETRPTSDRARESLFNILAHSANGLGLSDLSVLDVFAGTGAFGMEALSRGAKHATFIDSSRDAVRCLRETLDSLNERDNATVLQIDAGRPQSPPVSAQAPCDVVFMDAPYHSGLSGSVLVALRAKGWIKPASLCVVEVGAKEGFEAPEGFQMNDERIYGAAKFVFLESQ